MIPSLCLQDQDLPRASGAPPLGKPPGPAWARKLWLRPGASIENGTNSSVPARRMFFRVIIFRNLRRLFQPGSLQKGFGRQEGNETASTNHAAAQGGFHGRGSVDARDRNPDRHADFARGPRGPGSDPGHGRADVELALAGSGFPPYSAGFRTSFPRPSSTSIPSRPCNPGRPGGGIRGIRRPSRTHSGSSSSASSTSGPFGQQQQQPEFRQEEPGFGRAGGFAGQHPDQRARRQPRGSDQGKAPR